MRDAFSINLIYFLDFYFYFYFTYWNKNKIKNTKHDLIFIDTELVFFCCVQSLFQKNTFETENCFVLMVQILRLDWKMSKFPTKINIFSTILCKSSKKWCKAHWVSYLLTEAQNETELCLHLNRHLHHQFLMITVDENLVSFATLHRSNQWLSPGKRPVQTLRPDFRHHKVMLISFWNREGLIHQDLIEQKCTVNAKVCLRLLINCNFKMWLP